MAEKIFMPHPICIGCNGKNCKPVEYNGKFYMLCKKCEKLLKKGQLIV